MASNRSSTLFVDNLPISIKKIWIYNLFTKFGKIADIFLPNKRSKITNMQFGFVRFNNRKEAITAAVNTNHQWYWGQKLMVHTAKFGAAKQAQQHYTKDKRSKWIYKVKTPKQAEDNPISDDVAQAQDKPISGNTDHQVFRGAGEANIQHYFKKIHIHPSGNGWLMRSAVAKISKLLSPNELLEIFRRNNTPVEHIKAMGGRFVIITFPNSEIRDEIMKEEWLPIWFECIKPWSGESAKEERFAWLSCYGMPLNGWSVPNFKIIGDSWGEFLKVDDDTLYERSFEKGRILIVTQQSQRISGIIHMEIMGQIYSVRIEEDESFRIIMSQAFPTRCSAFETNKISEDEEAPEEKSLGEEKRERANSDEAKNAEEEQEVEVVNETPEIFINVEAGVDPKKDEAPQYAESNLQMVVFNPLFKSWKYILQSHNVVGNLNVGSPKVTITIEEEKPDSICSINSINAIETSQIDSSKANNLEIESPDADNVTSWSELPFNTKLMESSKKRATAEKIKRRKKSIEELIGFPKSKKGGRKIKKGVLLRSAIASAALSISSEGFRNRNRLILNEDEAARSVSKIIGEDFSGDDDEVISKLMSNKIIGENFPGDEDEASSNLRSNNL